MFCLKDFNVSSNGIPLSRDTSLVSHLVLYGVILNSELEAQWYNCFTREIYRSGMSAFIRIAFTVLWAMFTLG
jgi:hypothetical protein